MAVLPLRHFSPVEFRYKCGCGAGMEKMDADLLQMLDEARDLAGIPFPLSSAYRCPKHNKAVGGVPTSAHTRGYAVDIRCVDSHSRFVILQALLEAGFRRIEWLRRGFMWTTTRTSPATWPFASMEASTDGSDRD